jgi:hypothetical protein
MPVGEKETDGGSAERTMDKASPELAKREAALRGADSVAGGTAGPAEGAGTAARSRHDTVKNSIQNIR